MTTLKTGEHAPNWSVVASDGTPLELAQLVEQGPVAVFFFKRGCETTTLAAPYVQRIAEGYREHVSAENTRLQVIGLCQEGADVAGECKKAMGFDFPVAADEGLAASAAYRLESTPTLFLLRGRERLRRDSAEVSDADAYRVIDVVEGWSKEGYELFSDEIAARVGTLPLELYEGIAELAPDRPG